MKNRRLEADGLNIEFSQELADQEDKEAQARSFAAKQRVTDKQKKS